MFQKERFIARQSQLNHDDKVARWHPYILPWSEGRVLVAYASARPRQMLKPKAQDGFHSKQDGECRTLLCSSESHQEFAEAVGMIASSMPIRTSFRIKTHWNWPEVLFTFHFFFFVPLIAIACHFNFGNFTGHGGANGKANQLVGNNSKILMCF
jgi:hypothetical protein